MGSEKLPKLWWEDPISFLIKYGWAILLAIVIFLGLYFTRCYWNPDSCLSQIRIINCSPYDLQINLQGDTEETFNIPKCSSCQIYTDDVPSECPISGTTIEEKIAPGIYLLSVFSKENPVDPIPYYGELAVLPNEITSVCFFVSGNGFSGYDNFGNLIQSVITEQVETPFINVTITPTVDKKSTEWINYNNSDWGFLLRFPKSINDQEIFLIEHTSQVPLGPDEIILLSDVNDPAFQDIQYDEGLRVIIFREKPNDLSFDEWSVQMSKYAGSGELIPNNLGSCKENSIIASNPNFPFTYSAANWINSGEYYYGVLLMSKTESFEYASILDSFVPNGCE